MVIVVVVGLLQGRVMMLRQERNGGCLEEGGGARGHERGSRGAELEPPHGTPAVGHGPGLGPQLPAIIDEDNSTRISHVGYFFRFQIVHFPQHVLFAIYVFFFFNFVQNYF
jgi:hypothetical protein